jgi:methylglyoxal synthase
MHKKKNIGLIAHDHMKQDLIEWVEYNWEILNCNKLICTGTTGKLVEEAITEKVKLHKNNARSVNVTKLKSGPLGGDQQIGALIAEGDIDIVIFFWDPMLPQPHEVDVKALLRICVVYNVPTACNRSTADFMISSPLFQSNYKQIFKDYSNYKNRKL